LREVRNSRDIGLREFSRKVHCRAEYRRDYRRCRIQPRLLHAQSRAAAECEDKWKDE